MDDTPAMTMQGETGAPEPGRVVVVTGLSGAGKTSALRTLEDLGFETVDNLPLRLLPHLLPAPEESSATGDDTAPGAIAIGIDARTEGFAPEPLVAWLEELRTRDGIEPTLLFLDSSTEVLERRFNETRRRHPLGLDRGVADGIASERALLAPLRLSADLVLDTSDMSLTELKSEVRLLFALSSSRGLQVSVQSFSFKTGLPRGADMVLDVRFLRNPHWDLALRELTGVDRAVQKYVSDDPVFERFIDKATALLEELLPGYKREGKAYFTLAVGCTGGKHRSVFVAERLASFVRSLGYDVSIRHRNMERL